MRTDLTKLDRQLFHVSVTRDFGDRTPELCFVPFAFEPGFNEKMMTVIPHLMETTNSHLICVDGTSISLPASALPEDCQLVDISDRGLANAAVERLSRVSNAAQFEKLFAQLTGELETEGRAPLSPTLARFLKETPDITDDIVTLLPILMGYADSLSIPVSPYRQLNYLLNTISIESRIDFDAANREQEAILERLGQVLADPSDIIVRSINESVPELQTATPKSMLELGKDGPSNPEQFSERFQSSSLAGIQSAYSEGVVMSAATGEDILAQAMSACFKLKQEIDTTLAEFHSKHANTTAELETDGIVKVNELFLEIMPILNLRPDDFVNFVRNSHYRRRFHSIDIVAVVRELSALWNAVMRRFAKSPADHAYAKVTQQLRLLPALFNGVSQSADIATLQVFNTGDMHSDICEDLAQLIPESVLLQTFRGLENEFNFDYENAMAYYGHMKTAADRFVENTLAAMRERRSNSSLFFVGGFHADVVQAKLGERRVSFSTLIPRWAGKPVLNEPS